MRIQSKRDVGGGQRMDVVMGKTIALLMDGAKLCAGKKMVCRTNVRHSV